jgi:hypothetical protein
VRSSALGHAAVNDWSPTSIPVSGDTAVLDTGTVKLSNEGLSGVTINMTGTSEATQPVLALRDVSLNGTINSTGNGDFLTASFGEIDARGVVTSAGSIILSGLAPDAVPGGSPNRQAGHLTIDIHSGSSFVNTGTIIDSDFRPAALTVSGGTFVNNGTVESEGAFPEFDTKIVGTGTFSTRTDTLTGSGFTFNSSVSSGLTIDLSTVPGGLASYLTIAKPLQFLASIENFGVNQGDGISLPNISFAALTNETFADNHLKLFDGHKLVADLNIVGDFTIADFGFEQDPAGISIFVKAPATPTSDPPSIVPSMAAHA